MKVILAVIDEFLINNFFKFKATKKRLSFFMLLIAILGTIEKLKTSHSKGPKWFYIRAGVNQTYLS